MSDDAPELGKDVYLALAAVGWADGELDADEADAIVKTALEAGLDLEAVKEIEAATKAPVALDTIDVEALSAVDRRFVMAVASWMATLDGELAAGEAETLDALAGQLGVSAQDRADLDIVVREVAYASGGDSPFAYDLLALRARVAKTAG